MTTRPSRLRIVPSRPLSWPEFRARAHADAARLGVQPPDDDTLVEEFIDRRGQSARLLAWLEVLQHLQPNHPPPPAVANRRGPR